MKGNYLITNIYKSYYIQQAVMARVSIAQDMEDESNELNL